MSFGGELSDHFDLHLFLTSSPIIIWTEKGGVLCPIKNATFAPFQVLALLRAGEQAESRVLIGRQCLNLLLLLNSRPSPVSRAATAGERAREIRGKRRRARKFVWTRD